MSGTKLTQLFLFNPSWGPREGEEEEKVGFHNKHKQANASNSPANNQGIQTNQLPKNQVVFHWPANLDANTRVRSVGLIEAVVRWLLEYFNGLIEPFEVWGNL